LDHPRQQSLTGTMILGLAPSLSIAVKPISQGLG
jgi:hypothetical protein